VQIYFSNKSKEALEEVFVTDLEVDFPDFKIAQAAQRGVWETCVFNFFYLYSATKLSIVIGTHKPVVYSSNI